STLPSPRQEVSVKVNEPIPFDRNSLAQAFESFTHVAGSLENSYALLQEEVVKLRHELEIKNRDLAKSLAENRRMRTYLAGILEVLPCGVLSVDEGFRLRFANPQAHVLLSTNRDAGLESSLPIPETLRSLLREVAAEPRGTERTWALQALEDTRFLAVSCVVQSQSAGAGGETLFIIRDVTQAKRLDEEREFSRRMQALAEMTAVLAHEIRNPLGSLELFAGLIRDATKEHTEVSQWIVHMQAGLRALSATVNNVLHFHSMVPPHLKPLNVVRLLADTVEFLQPLALQRGMGIELITDEKEILIPADAHRLQQVFFNFTINAFRAMPSGKTLRIRAGVGQQSGHPAARIDFEDEGVGISMDHLDKIFDPGFSTVKSSPGLGLAVCRRVIAQHKGRIEVQSEVGKGTTFSLHLPVLGKRV
ncbi:MAG: ATP-binding protein, partial [Acidobacteriota bacterium]